VLSSGVYAAVEIGGVFKATAVVTGTTATMTYIQDGANFQHVKSKAMELEYIFTSLMTEAEYGNDEDRFASFISLIRDIDVNDSVGISKSIGGRHGITVVERV